MPTLFPPFMLRLWNEHYRAVCDSASTNVAIVPKDVAATIVGRLNDEFADCSSIQASVVSRALLLDCPRGVVIGDDYFGAPKR